MNFLLGQMELIFFVNYTFVANHCTYTYTTIYVMHKYTLMTTNELINFPLCTAPTCIPKSYNGDKYTLGFSTTYKLQIFLSLGHAHQISQYLCVGVGLWVWVCGCRCGGIVYSGYKNGNSRHNVFASCSKLFMWVMPLWLMQGTIGTKELHGYRMY